MHLDPFDNLAWAYQLHYYLCFRTRRRRARLTPELYHTLTEICGRHDYHLLQSRIYPDHLRCLVSLRPAQKIAKVIQTLKANSSPESGFWERGYLAQSVGRIRIETVKTYIDDQAHHHGYSMRLLPPVFRYRSEQPIVLTAAHASFELNYHLVFATHRRIGVFDSVLGQRLTSYWLRVAAKHGFAIDRVGVVPDHVHLLVRIAPKISIEECALALLNNGQYFVGKYEAAALVRAGTDRLWQTSAYAGTTGKVTTALLKRFLG
jgi:putative transposase